jgi:O-antigen ligase
MQGFSVSPARSDVHRGLLAGIAGLMLGLFTTKVSSLPPQWAPLFVAAVLFLALMMLVRDVRKLLLAVILWDIPFRVDIHPGYREEAAQLGAVAGFDISITTIVLVILYVMWIGEFFTKRASTPRPLVQPSLPVILYLAFAVLSVSVASDVTLSAFQIFLLLHMLLLYLYIASTVQTRQEVVFIVMMLLVGLILESAIIVGVGLTGRDFTFAGMSTAVDANFAEKAWQSVRPGGTIGSPNNAASYLSIALSIALGVMLSRLRPWYKWLAASALGLGGVALILTLSRGGWTAFAVSLVILCLAAWRRGWLSPTVLCALVITGALVALFYQDAIFTRLTEDDKGAMYSRIPLVKLALRMIAENPVLGVGANNFALRMNDYITPDIVGEWLYTVHNKYLLVWSETGIGGLLAFLWFFVATLRRGWQGWRFSDPILAPLALGLAAATCGHMVHMFSEVFNGRPLTELLALISGLLTVIHRLQREEARTT